MKKTTNRDQFKEMIKVMKKYPDIAKNITKKKPEEVCEFWENLQIRLNKLGPPMKEVVEWKKVWSDHKSHLRKKLIAQKREMYATGGGPNKKVCFTADEDEVIQLVELAESFDGMSNASRLGVHNDEDVSSEEETDFFVGEGAPSPVSTEPVNKSSMVTRTTASKPKDVVFITKTLGKTDTLQTFTIPVSNRNPLQLHKPPLQPPQELPPQSKQLSKSLSDPEKQTHCHCACPGGVKNENELEILAKAWALELRKMSSDQQIHAKRAIAEVMYQGQLGLLNPESARTKLLEKEKDMRKEIDHISLMEIEKEEPECI